MLWATFTIAFSCFLHSSEFTSGGTFDAAIHPTRLEVSFYPDLLQPDYFKTVFKKSKTDPFWETTKLTIAKSNSPVCAVTASRDYFQTSTYPAAQPLFQFSDGLDLTHCSFTHNLWPLLIINLWIDSMQYVKITQLLHKSCYNCGNCGPHRLSD